MSHWPINRVYYNEDGDLVVVYATAWSLSFTDGGDIAELEKLEADVPRRDENPKIG
jgi:hypothetical protein